ncbi:hypothetical protein CYY_002071 [Polysphondylium violaceum]|uniref:CUE domain-containing protein n=1 Tax=Polysphondylium violaceum TaxID=133409 RepID=A0A8J4Q0T9_9MYCE|nr:hypothetical protein CYY_002071 [Polysphondylium violaceum]
MSVPFDQAIQSLVAIFGDFDREIIETVLRQNQGHMEKTIDALLEMNGEQPINQNTDSDQNLAQMQQDEMLAKMLQDDMFINEIKNDDDFANLFTPEQLQQQKRLYQLQQQRQQQPNRPQQQQRGSNLTPREELANYYRERGYELDSDDEDQPSNNNSGGGLSMLEEDLSLKEIKEKIGQLSEAAKSKFRELTDLFMKREDIQYQSVNTNGDDEQEEEEKEDAVIYNKAHSNRVNINSSYRDRDSNQEGEEEYDSFVLDDRRGGGVKLRNMTSKKDD